MRILKLHLSLFPDFKKLLGTEFCANPYSELQKKISLYTLEWNSRKIHRIKIDRHLAIEKSYSAYLKHIYKLVFVSKWRKCCEITSHAHKSQCMTSNVLNRLSSMNGSSEKLCVDICDVIVFSRFGDNLVFLF